MNVEEIERISGFTMNEILSTPVAFRLDPPMVTTRLATLVGEMIAEGLDGETSTYHLGTHITSLDELERKKITIRIAHRRAICVYKLKNARYPDWAPRE